MSHILNPIVNSCRLADLTHLQIKGGWFHRDPTIPFGTKLWGLRELEICQTYCADTQCINAMLQNLAQLTYLWIDHRIFYDGDPPSSMEWAPIISLRYVLLLLGVDIVQFDSDLHVFSR